MTATGDWTITELPGTASSLPSRTVVAHPSGAVLTVAFLGRTPPESGAVTGAEAGLLPWTLTVGSDQQVAWVTSVLARFASRQDAIDAVVRADTGLLVYQSARIAWREGMDQIGENLAMETCPVHGFGLLQHDDQWSWYQQPRSVVVRADAEEVWVLAVRGTPRYAVVHQLGDLLRPWRICLVVGPPGEYDLLEDGPSFASRHAAVAHVESLRDELLPVTRGWAVRARVPCSMCDLEGHVTLA